MSLDPGGRLRRKTNKRIKELERDLTILQSKYDQVRTRLEVYDKVTDLRILGIHISILPNRNILSDKPFIGRIHDVKGCSRYDMTDISTNYLDAWKDCIEFVEKNIL